ncbi:hypothetical protein ACHWQZ_G012610 [Mnemiopsis leidyi]
MKNDNTSSYRIADPTDREILAGFKVLLSVTILVGDSLILVGSLRYNAVKLHNILVIFIQHMAVADFLVALFGVIPGAVSLAADDWVLGDSFCYITYFFKDSSEAFQCFIVTAIAMSKAFIAKYPFRAAHFSQKAGQAIAVSIWFVGIAFPAALLLNDLDGVFFNFITYTCDYSNKHSNWTKTHSIILGILLLLSLVGTVISSAVLLVIARQFTRGRSAGLKWQGIVTVLLTSGTHLLIAFPLALYYFCRVYTEQYAQANLFRYGWWISQLGSVINFFVLGLSLPSFRDFLKSKIFKREVRDRENEQETAEEAEERQRNLSSP